jgi:hypothetical protein
MVFELSTTNAFITRLAEIPEDRRGLASTFASTRFGNSKEPQGALKGDVAGASPRRSPGLHLIADSQISGIESDEFFLVFSRIRPQ